MDDATHLQIRLRAAKEASLRENEAIKAKKLLEQKLKRTVKRLQTKTAMPSSQQQTNVLSLESGAEGMKSRKSIRTKCQITSCSHPTPQLSNTKKNSDDPATAFNKKPKVSVSNKKRKKTTSDKRSEDRKRKDRDAARIRRAMIKQDPAAYEEQKRKDHERYLRKKGKGQMKSIIEMNPRQERQQRRKWKIHSTTYRKKQRIVRPTDLTTDPCDTPKNMEQISSSRKASGRKRVHRDRSTVYRRLAAAEKRARQATKLAEKYKKRFLRAQKLNLPSTPTPRRKVKNLLRGSLVRPEVKRSLLFSEVMKTQLKTNFKLAKGDKAKQLFTKSVSGGILKKYRMLHQMKEICSWKRYTANQNRQGLQYVRKKRINAISAQIMTEICNFLEQDCNSRMCPGKKDVITRGKVKKQKRLLSDTLKNLHAKFSVESNLNISYTTFCRFRPFWIVKPSCQDRNTCVCVRHDNMQLIVDRLHHLKVVDMNQAEELCASLCCDVQSQKCAYKECSNCKSKLLTTRSTDVLKLQTHYQRWVKIEEERKTENKNTITVKVTKKEKVACTVEELIDAFNTQLPEFLQHICNIRCQYRSIKSLKKNLKTDECLLHMDFSENYNCKYAEEVQSMHFSASRSQVTLHAVVVYVRRQEEDAVTPIAMCTLSPNARHDACAVWAHLKPILNYLQQSMPTITKVHFLSDGPSTQYKNKYNFCLFASLRQRHVFNEATWNFWESGHGKGAPDGIGGALKRAADGLVATGNDIADPLTLFEHLKSASNVKLHYITNADIEAIDTEVEQLVATTIPGTRKLHQLMWTAKSPHQLYIRHLSCFICPREELCHHNNEKKVRKVDLIARHSTCSVRSSLPNQPTIQVGQWIAVIYDDVWYPGLVEIANDECVTATFMHRSGNRFYWPSDSDKQTVPSVEILCMLDAPEPITARHFVFPKSTDVDKLLENVLQDL